MNYAFILEVQELFSFNLPLILNPKKECPHVKLNTTNIQTEKKNKKSAVTLAVTDLLNHSPRGTELGQNGFHCHTDRADQSWKQNNGLQLKHRKSLLGQRKQMHS